MRAVGWLIAVGAPSWLACSSTPVTPEPVAQGGETSAAGASGMPSGASGASGAESAEGGEGPLGGAAGAGLAGGGAGEPAGGGAGTEDGGAGGACDVEPVAVGTLEGDELSEVSGIVASATNPGVYYVHNDSGDRARFFAIDEQGRTLAEVSLMGATAVDWEDIALGPGPGGGSFIYLGDVGDNEARVGGTPRPAIDVYRVPEPLILSDEEPQALVVTDWQRLPLRYPGLARDCEAVLLDPLSSDLVLVTKENDGKSSVFRASALAPADTVQTLELLTGLELGTVELPGSSLVTGGELSPAGDAVLLRTYTSIFLWPRAAGTTLAEALFAAPRQLPAPDEAQGESITFSADGLSYLTVSEDEGAAIFRAPLSCEL